MQGSGWPNSGRCLEGHGPTTIWKLSWDGRGPGKLLAVQTRRAGASMQLAAAGGGSEAGTTTWKICTADGKGKCALQLRSGTAKHRRKLGPVEVVNSTGTPVWSNHGSGSPKKLGQLQQRPELSASDAPKRQIQMQRRQACRDRRRQPASIHGHTGNNGRKTDEKRCVAVTLVQGRERQLDQSACNGCHCAGDAGMLG